MRPLPASLPYDSWLIKQLRDPAEAAAYLKVIIEDGDRAAFVYALRQLARAYGLQVTVEPRDKRRA